MNFETVSIGIQKGISPGQGGVWFLPQISTCGQKHFEGATDLKNLQGEGGKPSLYSRHNCHFLPVLLMLVDRKGGKTNPTWKKLKK